MLGYDTERRFAGGLGFRLNWMTKGLILLRTLIFPLFLSSYFVLLPPSFLLCRLLFVA